MFVACCTSHGIRYVSIREHIIDADGRRRQVLVKNLGRLDVLEREDPDILAKLRAQYASEERRTVRENVREALESLRAAKCTQAAEGVREECKEECREACREGGDEDGGKTASLKSTAFPLRNYALCLLWPVWQKFLGLETRLSALRRTCMRTDTPLEGTVFYLAALKVLDPDSCRHAWRIREHFFHNHVHGQHAKDVYRVLDFLCSEKTRVLAALGNALERAVRESEEYAGEQAGRQADRTARLRFSSLTGAILVTDARGIPVDVELAPDSSDSPDSPGSPGAFALPCGGAGTAHSFPELAAYFRRMSSSFPLKQAFATRRELWVGHLVLCALALAMLRVLQLRLEAQGWRLSFHKISAALQGANMLVTTPVTQTSFFLNASALSSMFNQRNSACCRGKTDFCGSSRTDSGLSPLDMIFHATGCRPLQAANTFAELKKYTRPVPGSAQCLPA